MDKNELRIGNLVNEEVLGISPISDICEHVVMVKVNNGELDGTISKTTYTLNYSSISPIPLTEKWLLHFGFENWGYGKLYANEVEKYTRYVLHNVIDGTSNFELHFVESEFMSETQYIVSCDEDDRINFGVELEYVHQLQNMYFTLLGNDLSQK